MTIGSQQPYQSRARSPLALRCSLAVVLAMSPSLSQAGEAPPRQLYGKSVVLTWDTSVSFQYTGLGEPIRKAVLQNAMSIYVSSMGRVFRKTSNIVRTPKGEFARGASRAPDGKVIKSGSTYEHEIDFEGQKLFLTMKSESGARQVAVDFANDFGGCTLHVLYGKEENAPGIVIRAPSGRLTMMDSASSKNEACSVKDGNVFESEE